MIGFKQRLLGVTVAVAAGSETRRHLLDLILRREEFVEFVNRIALRLLRLFHRLRVGDDRHHLLLDGLRVLEEFDGVVVGLRHLLPVRAGNRRHRAGDVGVGELERLAVGVVELLGEVARHLEVLLLVFPDRHEVGVHHQDVRRHQDGIREQAVRRLKAVGELVLVAVTPLEKPHRGQAREIPRQFLHFRHVALAIHHRLLGVEPARDVVERHVPRRRTKRRAVANRRQGVEIRNEHEVFALLLKVEHALHRTEVITPVQLARRLYTRQNPHGSVLYHICGRPLAAIVAGSLLRPKTDTIPYSFSFF